MSCFYCVPNNSQVLSLSHSYNQVHQLRLQHLRVLDLGGIPRPLAGMFCQAATCQTGLLSSLALCRCLGGNV